MEKDSLSAHLLPRLKEAFPGQHIVFGAPPDPVATIRCIHPDVGDVSITDDGDEITLHLGIFTHTHIGLGEKSQDKVADSVIALLTDLFNDNLVLWRSPTDGAGGFYNRNDKPSAIARWLRSGGIRVAWSGPLREPHG
jgi:hypothetical protein